MYQTGTRNLMSTTTPLGGVPLWKQRLFRILKDKIVLNGPDYSPECDLQRILNRVVDCFIETYNDEAKA